jgi:hypothetical protein
VRNIITTAGGLIATALLAAACGGSSGQAQSIASSASALATSSAVVHAKQVATVEVIDPCKKYLPSVGKFKDCAESKLGITGDSDAAKAKRGSFYSCLIEAANADHVFTHDGRVKFETTGAPDCASQILLANSAAGGTGASPSPSPSGS